MEHNIKEKTYLSLLLDIEKNILTIDETVDKLEKYSASLCQKQEFEVPIKEKYESKESNSAGLIVGLFVGALVAFLKIVFSSSHGVYAGLIERTFGFLGDFIWGAIIGAIVGLVVGLIVNLIVKSNKNSKLEKIANSEYESYMKVYNKKLKEDEERINIEKQQKFYIREQINTLYKKKQSSINNSETIYNYNIIDKKYWHNILALSYFNQFDTQPIDNFSMEDARNNYKKASFCFENDLSKNLLITVPKEIINADDYSLRKQRDLFRIMKEIYNNSNLLSKEIIEDSRNLNKQYNETATYKYVEKNNRTEELYLNHVQLLFDKGEK